MPDAPKTRQRCYVGPPGDDREYWLPGDLDAWEASWGDYLATHGPQPAPDAPEGGTEVRDNAWDDIPF